MTDFEHWWYHEGNGPKLPGEDFEEHCKRMCQIAWSNGAYMEGMRAALKVEKMGIEGYGTLAIAEIDKQSATVPHEEDRE